MTRIDIINKLISKNNYKKYLEIGVQNGHCFNQIVCESKTAVDPESTVKECKKITSDEFFAKNKAEFDIIFIDGLHHYQQVYKDIKNALEVLSKNGTIVCHDMLPPDENHQKVPRMQDAWTGDCWKAWVLLRGTRSDLSMRVVDHDYGCGIITRGKQETVEYSNLTYANFVDNKEKWMNIVRDL
jgi:hypothetical protein